MHVLPYQAWIAICNARVCRAQVHYRASFGACRLNKHNQARDARSGSQVGLVGSVSASVSPLSKGAEIAVGHQVRGEDALRHSGVDGGVFERVYRHGGRVYLPPSSATDAAGQGSGGREILGGERETGANVAMISASNNVYAGDGREIGRCTERDVRYEPTSNLESRCQVSETHTVNAAGSSPEIFPGFAVDPLAQQAADVGATWGGAGVGSGHGIDQERREALEMMAFLASQRGQSAQVGAGVDWDNVSFPLSAGGATENVAVPNPSAVPSDDLMQPQGQKDEQYQVLQGLRQQDAGQDVGGGSLSLRGGDGKQEDEAAEREEDEGMKQESAREETEPVMRTNVHEDQDVSLDDSGGRRGFWGGHDYRMPEGQSLSDGVEEAVAMEREMQQEEELTLEELVAVYESVFGHLSASVRWWCVISGPLRGTSTAMREGWRLLDEMTRDRLPVTIRVFEGFLATITASARLGHGSLVSAERVMSRMAAAGVPPSRFILARCCEIMAANIRFGSAKPVLDVTRLVNLWRDVHSKTEEGGGSASSAAYAFSDNTSIDNSGGQTGCGEVHTEAEYHKLVKDYLLQVQDKGTGLVSSHADAKRRCLPRPEGAAHEPDDRDRGDREAGIRCDQDRDRAQGDGDAGEGFALLPFHWLSLEGSQRGVKPGMRFAEYLRTQSIQRTHQVETSGACAPSQAQSMDS